MAGLSGARVPRAKGNSQTHPGTLEDPCSRVDKLFKQPGNTAGPSDAVRKSEDIAIRQLSLNSLSLAGPKSLPPRPGYGTRGQTIVLWTNYFELAIKPQQKIHKYQIEIKLSERGKPTKESQKATELGARKRRVLFACLFRSTEWLSAKADACVATDYSSILLSSRSLSLGPSDSASFNIVYRENEEVVDRQTADTWSMTVTKKGIVPTQELIQYLSSPAASRSTDNISDAIQALNIIVARHPNEQSDIWQSGKNKFFLYPNEAIQNDAWSKANLTGGLIALRGYFSSVRTSHSRILLNVNAQCSPFYPACWVDEYIQSFGSSDTNRQKSEPFLNKLRVVTFYNKDPDGKPIPRVQTITGFSHATVGTKEGNALCDYGNANSIRFKHNGVEKSVAEYFKEQYNVTLELPQAWVINVGPFKAAIWIPCELALILPGQAFRGLLSEDQTRAMLRMAARPPAENARRIVGPGLDLLGLSPSKFDPCLEKFGITVNNHMLTVQARLLDHPKPVYKRGAVDVGFKASWDLKDKRFHTPAQTQPWACITVRGQTSLAPPHLQELQRQLRNLGLSQQNPLQREVTLPPSTMSEGQIDQALSEVLDWAQKNKIVLLLCVLRLRSTDIMYERLKFLADVKYGIHTVCANYAKQPKWNGQYWGNIALKINTKLGGINHILPPEILAPISNKPLMIVGIDVAHPSPESMEDSPSIAAVVASCSKDFASFPGSIRTNPSKQEMVSGLSEMIAERLQHFYRKVHGWPRQLLVYRDGVSEGQYETLLADELAKIEKGCQIAIPREFPQPGITIVVAGKRHHTRFFPQDVSKDANTLAGTVVDRGITMKDGHDFFLQAHHALTGTARPCHYVVVKDSLKLKADEIQTVTHGLCYLYARATKAVSLCPPVYYADLLCERGRKYLARYLARGKFAPSDGPKPRYDAATSPWVGGVHPKIKDSMFYI